MENDTVDIFVYGTLRKGGSFQRRLGVEILDSVEATAKGELRTNGSYPMARFDRGDTDIVGEVHTVSQGDLDRFDYLEGHPHMYRRRDIEVTLEDGTTKTVQSYEFQLMDDWPHLLVIENGDYLKWLER